MIPTALLLLLTAAPLTLYQGGQPRCTVVVAAEQSERVQAAAAELATYLGRIGGTAPVVAESSAPARVPIQVSCTGAGDESIRLVATPHGVSIAGGCDRAVWFAVYRFLERLGCRWLTPEFDHVPSLPDLAIEPFTLSSAPAFDLRTFICRTPERAAWGLKLGLNGFDTREAAAQYGALELGAQTHTYHQFIPTDRWFATHPEWFPLIGGQRLPGGVHAGQLCVTATGLADAFAEAVNSLIMANPMLEYVSISPNDGSNWCECEHCLALDEKLSGNRMADLGLGAPRKYVGDRVFWFANEVAKRVGPQHPNVKLLCLAYISYAEPPQTVTLEPNVVPWLCHYAPADYSRPIADHTSAPNATFDGILSAWAQRNPNLLYYGYVSKSMWWRLPRPVLHNFAADLRHLRKLGVHRYYAQSSFSDWVLDGPLYYVLAHLMWEPAADVDALADEWRDLVYGPAGPAMTQFDAAVERAVKATGQSYSDNPPRHVPGLFATEQMDEADRHLAAATAAAGQEPYAARVADAVKLFRYGREVIACLEDAAKFHDNPDPALLASARSHGERSQQYGRHSEVKQFVDSLLMQSQLGVIASGLGEAVTKGGRTCWNTDETGRGDGASGWMQFVIQVPDPTRPVTLEMEVWGASDQASVSINTGGNGLSTRSGGVWTSIQPEPALNGKEEWQTLTYTIPVEALAPGRTGQRLGMGGGDSQIWLAGIRVRQ